MAEPHVISVLVGKPAELAEIGVREKAQIIRTKISRGGFSAEFFVECLQTMGCDTVRLCRRGALSG